MVGWGGGEEALGWKLGAWQRSTCTCRVHQWLLLRLWAHRVQQCLFPFVRHGLERGPSQQRGGSRVHPEGVNLPPPHYHMFHCGSALAHNTRQLLVAAPPAPAPCTLRLTLVAGPLRRGAAPVPTAPSAPPGCCGRSGAPSTPCSSRTRSPAESCGSTQAAATARPRCRAPCAPCMQCTHGHDGLASHAAA